VDAPLVYNDGGINKTCEEVNARIKLQLQALINTTLSAFLKKMGVAYTGKKQELINRILDKINTSSINVWLQELR